MKHHYQEFPYKPEEFSRIQIETMFRNNVLGFLKLKTTQLALSFVEKLRRKGYLDNEINLTVTIKERSALAKVSYLGKGHPPREPELFDPPLDGVK